MAVILSLTTFTATAQAKKSMAETSKNNSPLMEIMQEQDKLVAKAKQTKKTTEDNTNNTLKKQRQLCQIRP
jgi:hypothetical protein